MRIIWILKYRYQLQSKMNFVDTTLSEQEPSKTLLKRKYLQQDDLKILLFIYETAMVFAIFTALSLGGIQKNVTTIAKCSPVPTCPHVYGCQCSIVRGQPCWEDTISPHPNIKHPHPIGDVSSVAFLLIPELPYKHLHTPRFLQSQNNLHTPERVHRHLKHDIFYLVFAPFLVEYLTSGIKRKCHVCFHVPLSPLGLPNAGSPEATGGKKLRDHLKTVRRIPQ